jgi:hypothetical protein
MSWWMWLIAFVVLVLLLWLFVAPGRRGRDYSDGFLDGFIWSNIFDDWFDD